MRKLKSRLSFCLPTIFLFVTIAQISYSADRPNILLILSDDHSVPYLGCYGNDDMNTPNLDKLAEEGIMFNHAYTNAPQCVPSRATILTGRNVLDVQMLRFSAPLDKNIITFPELLRKEGYFTGICGRRYHLDGSGRKAEETVAAFEEFGMVTFQDRVDYLNMGYQKQVNIQVKEFLDLVPNDKPFFLWANYDDPHRKFTAPEFEPDPQKISIPERFPDTDLLRKDLAAHIGEINRVDMYIGEVIEELKKRGIYDNTLIIFMGDNGAALLRGKGTLYDCGIHVPLLARYPKLIEEGTVSDALVMGSDIALTVLDVAGIEPDAKMTGKSYKNILQGSKENIHKYGFAVRGSHGQPLPGTSADFDLSRTIYNQDFRLIYNPLFHLPYHPVDFAESEMWAELIKLNQEGKLDKKFSDAYIFTKERPMFELYDLRNDPNEFINRFGDPDYKEIQHELMAQLHRWMIIYRDVVPLPILPPSMRK